MVLSDLFSKINFYDLNYVLLENNYYKYFFPFLLFYAFYYVVLAQIKVFKKVKDGKETINKPLIIVISFILSFISITFPIGKNNETAGDFITYLFPNITIIGIFLLSLFILNTLLNKNYLDFFSGGRGLDIFIKFILLLIAFGSVLYNLGVFSGVVEYDYLNNNMKLNYTFAMIFFIVGILLLLAGANLSLSLILIFPSILFFIDSNKNNILTYFLDPFLIIFVIFINLIGWVSSKEKD